MMTPFNDVQDVAQCRSLCRSHNADPRRQRGNWLLALAGEKSLSLKFCFELFKGQLQRSRALGLKIFRGNLQLAAIFVDRHASAHDDLEAVCRAESQQARRRAEHDDANLRVAIFQREIKMAGS